MPTSQTTCGPAGTPGFRSRSLPPIPHRTPYASANEGGTMMLNRTQMTR